MNTLELVKLNNLQLVSRLISDQLMMGIHGSKKVGLGVEFEQYRHYLPGDDLKKIDWKLYARSGKHQIKESSTESNLKVNFILDLSGSMNYTEDGVSRLDFAKILAASLALQVNRQGDELLFHTLKNNGFQREVGGGKSAFQKMLYALEGVKAEGKWDFVEFPELKNNSKELIVFISDLIEVNNEWLQFVKQMATPRKQILIFQILGENELNFNIKGFFRFKDLETGKEIEVNAEAIKNDYESNFKTYLTLLDDELDMPFVHYVRASMKDSIYDTILKGIKQIRLLK